MVLTGDELSEAERYAEANSRAWIENQFVFLLNRMSPLEIKWTIWYIIS